MIEGVVEQPTSRVERLRRIVQEAFCVVEELAGHPRANDVADYLAKHLDQQVLAEDIPNERLAAAGFHRIGRLDAVGRRSLWLLEEARAITLRAGREGDDSMLRVEADDPFYVGLRNVLATARFAAEWEIEGGSALERSYALDRNPCSLYCSDAAASEQTIFPAINSPGDLCMVLHEVCADPDASNIPRALDLMLTCVDEWWNDSLRLDSLFTSLDPSRLKRSVGQTLLARTDMSSKSTPARRAFVDRFLAAESARGTAPETIDRLRRAFTRTSDRSDG